MTRRSVSTVAFLVRGRCCRDETSPVFCMSFRGRFVGRLLTPLAAAAPAEFTEDGWLVPGSLFAVMAGEEVADGDCLMPLTPVCAKDGRGRFIFGG